MAEIAKKEDLIVWEFDFALTTFYEIDTDYIEHLIPRRLSLMEVAPGMGLINVTAFNFPEGALGHMPEFQELILSVIVSPDLSRGVPRFAMYVLSLASTCQEHLDHSADYYKLPISGKLTKSTIDRDALSISYDSDEGNILTMNNCDATLDYKSEERYFQAYTSDGGEIYIADITIMASQYEHQLAGNVGTLQTHSFFHEIDMEEAEPIPYLQMIGRPGDVGKQSYYRPEIF